MLGDHRRQHWSRECPETNQHLGLESAAFTAHELERLLDEDMTEEEARELEEAEAIGRKFLAWNLGDVTAVDQPPKGFATEVLGMVVKD